MCTTPTSQGGPQPICSWKQLRRGTCVISYQLVARAPKDLPLSPPQSEKQWSQSWSGGNLENVAHGPRKPRNARRQRGTICGHLDHSRGLSMSWRPTSWRHQKQLWSEPKKLGKNYSTHKHPLGQWKYLSKEENIFQGQKTALRAGSLVIWIESFCQISEKRMRGLLSDRAQPVQLAPYAIWKGFK